MLVKQKKRKSTVQVKLSIAKSIINFYLGHHGVIVQIVCIHLNQLSSKEEQEHVLMVGMVEANAHGASSKHQISKEMNLIYIA